MAEFVEFKKEGIWEHFLREAHGHLAKCKLCKSVLNYEDRANTSFHYFTVSLDAPKPSNHQHRMPPASVRPCT